MVNDRTDVIVVGSGFGGAVTACRLASRSYRVVVLERGRRWARPRLSARARRRLDLRRAPPRASQRLDRPPPLSPHGRRTGRRRRRRLAHLREHPRRREARAVRRRLAARDHPRGARPLLRLGRGDDGRPAGAAHAVAEAHLAHARRRSRDRPRGPLPPGRPRGDVRPRLQATNTLDLNDLAVAERHGAEIRPLHSGRRGSSPAGTRCPRATQRFICSKKLRGTCANSPFCHSCVAPSRLPCSQSVGKPMP
ncbi:MAG: FAD-binding protein [Chloroflexi bacterium]|nr:FAD-binding protein [Chloroflexota bacterium]